MQPDDIVEGAPLLDECAPDQWARFTQAEQSRVRACLHAAERIGQSALVACLGTRKVDTKIIAYVLNYMGALVMITGTANRPCLKATIALLGMM